MTLIRVTVALDKESKESLHEEARKHRLSLSAWLRVMAKIMQLPAPADRPWPTAQAKAIIEEERSRLLRNKEH